MADTDLQADLSIDAALRRLVRAVDGLESAVERRLRADTSLSALHEDVQRLGQDRSELAHQLDQAEARAERLGEANKEVSHRLVTAMETIRGVLDSHGG